MFCPQCGTQNPDGAVFCSQCRNQLSTPAPMPGGMVFPQRQQYTVSLPPQRELAMTLMFWMGHVLAVLGWIFAIVCWVQANGHSDSMFGMGGNPLQGFLVTMGFLCLLSGHALQILCFWGSVLLRSLSKIEDKLTQPADQPTGQQ